MNYLLQHDKLTWERRHLVTYQNFNNTNYGNDNLPQYTCFTHKTGPNGQRQVTLCPNISQTKLQTAKTFYPSKNKHNRCGMMLTANLADTEWILIDCHQQMAAEVFCSLRNKEKSQETIGLTKESLIKWSNIITFVCDGGYVSVLHRCDGHVDCPNDESDEAQCVCTHATNIPSHQIYLCKEVVSSENKSLCGHLYFRNLLNFCQKYTTGNHQELKSDLWHPNNRQTSKCSNGENIDSHKIDDLFGDCDDASDEPALLYLLQKDFRKNCSPLPHAVQI